MAQNPQILQRIKKEIDKCNLELGKAENVMKFVLITDEWTQANGFLTPTLKIKRNKVLADYVETINRIYEQ